MANIKDGLSAATKELSAFKKFISRGNVIDMAVGVIIERHHHAADWSRFGQN